MAIDFGQTGGRSLERLRAHYLIEQELADRLRNADAADRQHLYSTVYDELFRRVPDHPQLTRKASADATVDAVRTRLRLLNPFLKPHTMFMEIGPGDCSLAIEIASRARRVYAVDVSAEITKSGPLPANFELIICEGAKIPVPSGVIDVAFSYQLVEHLHPDDAWEHLTNVCRCLAPGGVYVCVTPSRLNGPHDISRFFETEARGFHMKEYTTSELARMARDAGFSSSRILCGTRGHFLQLPLAPAWALEHILDAMPHSVRKPIAMAPFVRQLLGVTIIARK
jgi:SAM-dependent methyltransferase